MQHNQIITPLSCKASESIMGPAGSENLARRDGEENDHSTFREPESDSSVLKTAMYSVNAIHSQGQIGSLQLRIKLMPVTTSLIEICQAVWTLLRADRQKDMTKAIGPTYFVQRSFKRSPERGHVFI
jgi:hypothetical protein